MRLSVQVIAEQNGRRESGSAGGGGRTGYAHFSDEVLKDYANKAVSQALVNLDSRPAPAGTMTVVLGPGWPGILLHEAIGHGLEGDFNRKGSSAFSGRIGERVGAPGVTVVDDGTLSGRRGSLTVDDEGNPTTRTVLIEDGVLRGYLQDSLNARLMKMPLCCLPMGLAINSFIPEFANSSGHIFSGNPEQRITEISGLMAISFSANCVPVMFGMTWSVMTRSNSSGFS